MAIWEHPHNSDGTIGFAYSDLSVDTHTITLSVTEVVLFVRIASFTLLVRLQV